MNKRLILACLVVGFLSFGSALAQHPPGHHPPGHAMTPGVHHGMPPGMQAKALLNPTQNQQANGWVKFEARNGKMHVWGEISGLTPGLHGIHVHEFGDCSTPDASSAGGHFAPLNVQTHGAPEDHNKHTGDLGNLTADATGLAKFDREVDGMHFLGHFGILGRGLIVHATVDDLKSQPAGNAGARISCGVIGVSKP